MTTVVLDDPSQLQTVYDSINEDFNRIDYGDWLRDQLDIIADLHRRYFDTSTGPDGQRWAPNARSTIQQKGHAVILRGKQGIGEANRKAERRRPSVRFSQKRWVHGFRLATSLTAKTHQSFGDAIREAIATDEGGVLTFGTFVPYSIYNQVGTSRAVARPHVGLTAQYVDRAASSVADYTVKQLIK